jgi:hypothetical protein
MWGVTDKSELVALSLEVLLLPSHRTCQAKVMLMLSETITSMLSETITWTPLPLSLVPSGTWKSVVVSNRADETLQYVQLCIIATLWVFYMVQMRSVSEVDDHPCTSP